MNLLAHALIALCFLSSFPILASPPPHCPSSCGHIHNLSYPFGAAEGCGAPGFTLQCSPSPARWKLPSKKPLTVVVAGIHDDGSSGVVNVSLRCTPPSKPKKGTISAPNDAIGDLDSCHQLAAVDLCNLSPPNFTLSPLTVYILFRCSSSLQQPGVSRTDEKYCTESFEEDCGETQNAHETSRSCCCVQSNPCMQKPEVNESLTRCRAPGLSIASLLPHEQIPASGNALFIQMSWSKSPDISSDDRKHNDREHCSTRSACSGKVLIAVGVVVVLVLVAVVIFSVCIIQKSKTSRMRSAPGGSGPAVVSGTESTFVSQRKCAAMTEFTFAELDQATESFSDHRLLGDGGFGAVYKGRLYDGRIVAIKRLYSDNLRRKEQFLNEIRVLSSLKHAHLVKLYGYCCEDQRDLLLVFEYVSNGTLTDHLQNPRGEALPWKTRLKIALETSQALFYLHNRLSPIFHRDVKSQNILLDRDFHVKLADFGLSRFVPLHASHVSTIPQGTPGYLDPDYCQCYQLTDKSDVYSFGVVLVELVSALPAVEMSRKRGEINLSSLAISKISCGAWQELLDSRLQINREPHVEDMARNVMELAFRCLAVEKDDRPDMKDVERELTNIWNSGYGELVFEFSMQKFRETNTDRHRIESTAWMARTSVLSPWPSSSDSSCSN